MTGRKHPDGFCTCRHHSAQPWDRPEHWRADEVAYLEGRFGRITDEAIARHLGRTEHQWLSLTELSVITGHSSTWLRWYLRPPLMTVARRGTHWYVRADEVDRIPKRSAEAVNYAAWLHERTLERRRARRKGIAA